VVTRLVADSCILWTGFDVSVVARSYAQFTGILAGFAFVVINLVLDRAYRRRSDGRSMEPREVEHETQVGIALVCAFLGLVLTTLRYALLAGESGCALIDGRAASVEVLTAVSFGASMYMLLYAIVQFFSGTAGILARHCVFIMVVLVPPISVFLVEDTLTHLALSLGNPQTHRPLQPLWDWATRLAVPIPLAVGLVGAVAWYLGIKRRRLASPAGRVAQQLRTVVPYITVAVVAAVIVRSIMGLRYANPAAHISPGEAWLWVALLAVALLAQSTALSFQKGVEVPFTTSSD
jgi:heme/copper-type cytochrome/quinol oxidase subunit 2